jgi:predicted DNA-binding transcriptional regulator YafY
MRVVRSEIPIFDRVKFAKVRALYASTLYAGERHAAHRKMELLARAAGLTIEQAADIAGGSRARSLNSSRSARATPLRSFGLVYRTDSAGTSTRTVSLLWISQGNGHPGYLRCHCHLRGEFRSFRIDRVIRIFDPGAGQVLADDPSSIRAWVRSMGKAPRAAFD